MSKMKTVLGFFVVLLLAGNAFSQLRPALRRPNGLARPLGATSAAQEEVQSVTPGVTAPFIPFDEKDKIKYEDAVERAKKNDSEAFYWLAYYFINGEGVEKNREAAGKFLQKAVDACNAKACYLTGLCLEHFSLWGGRRSVDPGRMNDVHEIIQRLRSAIGLATILKMPESIVPDSQQGWRKRYSYTNDVATGYVIDLYSKAIKGGLAYATNDIARLKRTIVEYRERIAAEADTRAKGTAALDLLTDTNEVMKKAATNIQESQIHPLVKQNEMERLALEKSKQQREYWSTWPTGLGEGYAKLVLDAENKFNCVIDKSGEFTNVWMRGGGKSLIVGVSGGWRHDRYCKIGSDGTILTWTSREEDLEELKWIKEEEATRLNELRTKWAAERGMSLEEAKSKYDEWSKSSPSPFRRNRLIGPGGTVHKGQSK